MRYRFHITDVFTDRVFGGNQLAVLTDARGLDGALMQKVATEMGFSETSFVLPPENPAHAARVRIFTPKAEMRFAGHPTVGTALVLAWTGLVPVRGSAQTILLEELAGLVPVEIRIGDHGRLDAELTAPGEPRLGPPLDPLPLAAALGLAPGDLVTSRGLPREAATGNSFVMVELAGLEALARARLDARAVLPAEDATGVLVFTRATGSAEHDIRARMFAPAHGVAEDPATGSAAAALAVLLGSEGAGEGWQGWRIGQGIEMGRPSLIHARARRQDGAVVEVRVAGGAVPVADGWIEVPVG